MHFLKKDERPSALHRSGLVVGKPRACVTVCVAQGGAQLVVQPASISIAKKDALFWPLPPRTRVVDEEGQEVRPSLGCCFYVSLETFDPYHLVLEAYPHEMV